MESVRAIILTELTNKHHVVRSVIDEKHVSFEILRTNPETKKLKTELGLIYTGTTNFYAYLLSSTSEGNKYWYCAFETIESKTFMKELMEAGLIQKADIINVKDENWRIDQCIKISCAIAELTKLRDQIEHNEIKDENIVKKYSEIFGTYLIEPME